MTPGSADVRGVGSERRDTVPTGRHRQASGIATDKHRHPLGRHPASPPTGTRHRPRQAHSARRRDPPPGAVRVSHGLERPGPGAGDCKNPGMKCASASSAVSPYDEIPREKWARLSQQTPLPLSDEYVPQLRRLGNRLDLHDGDAVYRPISRLLYRLAAAAQSLRPPRGDFLAQPQLRTPYVIAMSGSVAA